MMNDTKHLAALADAICPHHLTKGSAMVDAPKLREAAGAIKELCRQIEQSEASAKFYASEYAQLKADLAEAYKTIMRLSKSCSHNAYLSNIDTIKKVKAFGEAQK